MLNFPPPPPPPIDVSQLEHLAQYYQNLLDYYQQAARIAQNQLAHIEALLHPNELLAFPSDSQGKAWGETASSKSSQSLAMGSPIPQLSASPQERGTVMTDGARLELLATELASNRGKMLHLDYLVRKLYGESEQAELESARTTTRKLLEYGTSRNRWFAAPDSPDCWTIDLALFPDLIAQPTTSKRSPPHVSRTTLFDSQRLAGYATVAEAIAVCLEQHYPNSMTTSQIADWFYPEGLSPSKRQKVHSTLSNPLSAGCNKTWRRVRLGEYIWKPD